MDILNKGNRTIGHIEMGKIAKCEKKEGEKLLRMYPKELVKASDISVDVEGVDELKAELAKATTAIDTVAGELETKAKELEVSNKANADLTKELSDVKDANGELETKAKELEELLEEATKDTGAKTDGAKVDTTKKTS